MAETAGTSLEQKQNYLDILAVCYYVVGALAGLLSLFALFYIGFGGVMLVQPSVFDGDPPPAFVGCMVLGIGLFGLALGWSYTAGMIWAGRCLSARRRYDVVMVMAAVSCLFTPFGTILGILSIILLVQPDVKALFAPAPSAAPTPPIQA